MSASRSRSSAPSSSSSFCSTLRLRRRQSEWPWSWQHWKSFSSTPTATTSATSSPPGILRIRRTPNRPALLRCRSFGRQQSPALANQLLLLLQRHSQRCLRSRRQLAEDKLVRCRQFPLPLRRAKKIPPLHRHPEDPRHIWSRNHPFNLQQLRIPPRPGSVRDHSPPIAIQIRQSKHLPPNGLISHPEDKIRTPLHCVHYMRQSQQKSANPLSIHSGSINPAAGPDR